MGEKHRQLSAKEVMWWGLLFITFFLVHFVLRGFLGFGSWISAEDASRTPINKLARIWDQNLWLDPVLIAFFAVPIVRLYLPSLVGKFRERTRSTPLTLAAFKGDSATVKTLVASGADVNERDKNGDLPLAYAAATGDLASVQKLLSSGADINARNQQGSTALMLAAHRGGADVLGALIAAGADVNARNTLGQTALSFAGSVEASILRAAGAKE
jgi:hypothetical protein